MGLFYIPILFFHSCVSLYPVLDLGKNTDELSGSGVAMAWCPAHLHSVWTEKMHFAILTGVCVWGGEVHGWGPTTIDRSIRESRQICLWEFHVMQELPELKAQRKKVNVVLVCFCFWNRSSAYSPDAFKRAILWPLLALYWDHTCVLPCRFLR